jgi:citrate lyase subunit beta/citryl-CoA lyase
MVETAHAFFRLREIVSASPRIVACNLGGEDFALDGKMVDIPIIVRAQKLIARYDAIKKREARTLAAVEHKA